MKKYLITACLSTVLFCGFSQRPANPSSGSAPAGNSLPALSSRQNGPKPYKDVITEKAISQTGLFSVHKVDDHYYFEIQDSIFGREILAVTRVSKTPGGANSYGGEIANKQTLVFEKGPNTNVFIRDITLINMADSTQTISKAVANSSVNSLAAVFPITAYGKDSGSIVIDVTDFFKGDNVIVSIPQNSTGLPMQVTKRKLNISSLQADRSYIQSIHSFPINTEIRSTKTFNASPALNLGNLPVTALPAADATGVVTMEMNTSMILLPVKPMARRLFDNRVGYFADEFVVYNDIQQKVDPQTFIVRYRLEPRSEDMDKYKRGELVEPQKPIVYYIDPATPKQWIKYLIAGINDWQKAFEKAGFKNAIIGKEWPSGDSTMSLEDARFSVLRYFASDIPNAYGPQVHDPRSGEIMESHVGWYHNVMQLLHDWYFIQTAAVDPRARKMEFDEELMGTLIRFVSSHEIGHTLGLRHNMGSSSKTPVEKLRDKAWVEANGHTSSIMDYARFNYVAQPEDNISEMGLFPRIGDYDLWAIEWGYRYSGAADEKADKKINNRWIVERVGANPRLWFGGEGLNPDPRAQTEDLGDNSMKASEYGIKNLKRIVPKLAEWTREEGDNYENLSSMYRELIGQFARYMGHVTKNIGGINETLKSVEQPGDVYEPSSKEIQRSAIAFLHQQLFETPDWLLDKSILNKISNPAGAETIGNVQANVLNGILSGARLYRLVNSHNRFNQANCYTPEQLLEDLKKGLWSELGSRKTIDGYRRNLQKLYVEDLLVLISPPAAPAAINGQRPVNLFMTDIPSAARAHLVSLKNEINQAISGMTDKVSQHHLQDLSERIKNGLDKNRL